jgi:hypothetical protein
MHVALHANKNSTSRHLITSTSSGPTSIDTLPALSASSLRHHQAPSTSNSFQSQNKSRTNPSKIVRFSAFQTAADRRSMAFSKRRPPAAPTPSSGRSANHLVDSYRFTQKPPACDRDENQTPEPSTGQFHLPQRHSSYNDRR